MIERGWSRLFVGFAIGRIGGLLRRGLLCAMLIALIMLLRVLLTALIRLLHAPLLALLELRNVLRCFSGGIDGMRL